VIDDFKEYALMIEEKFNFENIKTNGCVFKKNVSPELDELWGKVGDIESEIERVRTYLSGLIDADVKTNYNDKNGFYYETTKKRAEELKKHFKDNNPENINISTVTSQAKMTSDTLTKLSNGHVVLKNKIQLETTSLVKSMVIEWYKKYYEQSLKHVIEGLGWCDVFYSYAKVAIEWNYYRPQLIQSENSFVDAKELRHPIIEQLLRNEKQSFIPNDICIGCDKSYLLYGVNSVGKSSLMKSVGLSIIMAQAGMYVASNDYKLSPYEKIIVRIGNTDDLFDAHSSFVSEIKEASRVVKFTDNKTLVIADEFCASTERDSATQIVTTMLQWLSEKKSSYIFATHLFELLETTEDLEGLNVVHLKITVDKNGWTFDRKLTEGPPAERNYGAMIAKTMFSDKKFLKMLDRNKIMKKIEKKTSKRSKYNAALVVKECAVCGYTPSGIMSLPLDVHHINMQCTANMDGFIDNYHKNTKSNLVVLCKTCHIDVHSNRLNITGYEQHSTGVKLNFKSPEHKK
jgi:DNA mismatch repair protein MutS